MIITACYLSCSNEPKKITTVVLGCIDTLLSSLLLTGIFGFAFHFMGPSAALACTLPAPVFWTAIVCMSGIFFGCCDKKTPKKKTCYGEI